jgi:hypothetical protein
VNEPPASFLDESAARLADAAEAAIPGWVVRCVVRVYEGWSGPVPAEVEKASRVVGEKAAADIGGQVRRLLEADIDQQWTTPLELLRTAVRYPTALLAELGVPPVERDDFSARRFPDDLYGLSPASFGDIDPELGEAGLVWGAAKAFEHRRRHGGQG